MADLQHDERLAVVRQALGFNVSELERQVVVLRTVRETLNSVGSIVEIRTEVERVHNAVASLSTIHSLVAEIARDIHQGQVAIQKLSGSKFPLVDLQIVQRSIIKRDEEQL